MILLYILVAWILLDVLGWHFAAAVMNRKPKSLPYLYRPFMAAYRRRQRRLTEEKP
jgi:hypothetical protein